MVLASDSGVTLGGQALQGIFTKSGRPGIRNRSAWAGLLLSIICGAAFALFWPHWARATAPACSNLHQVRAAGRGGAWSPPRSHGRCHAPVRRSRHLVFAQVLQRHGTSVRGHFGGNLLGDGAFVERLGALLRDQAHRLGQVFFTSRSPRFRGAVLPERSRWWRATCPCSFAPGARSWPGVRS